MNSKFHQTLSKISRERESLQLDQSKIRVNSDWPKPEGVTEPT